MNLYPMTLERPSIGNQSPIALSGSLRTDLQSDMGNWVPRPGRLLGLTLAFGRRAPYEGEGRSFLSLYQSQHIYLIHPMFFNNSIEHSI
jgi:hypothetical protein